MSKFAVIHHTISTSPSMDDLCYGLTGKSVDSFVADILHNPNGKYGSLFRQVKENHKGGHDHEQS